MGFVFSRIFSSLFGSKETRILILGLDNAGKTTLLYKMQLGTVAETIPSKIYSAISFNVETVVYRNIKLQVWDLGGQGSLRPYWRCYYQGTNAIIYVVDSADTTRLNLAREELTAMLSEGELQGVPLLVLANKQDLPGALGDAEVTQGLGLQSIRNRQWQIFRSSIVTNLGVAEALDWLVSQINSA